MPEKERLSPTETRAYDSFQRMTSMTTFGRGTIAYNYDSLGRTQAATAGTDGWGNRLTQSAVKSAVPTMVTITDPATNRIQSPTYDANGNTVNTPQQVAMTYDVMNRLKTVASDTYGYDPSNKRIWKNDEYTFYGAGGERIGRYSATKFVNDTGTHVFVFQKVQVDEYFGGRRLTTQDRLGSVGSYYPYGESRSGTVSNADSFATYYQDSTGLDYADQRHYAAGSGRFTTADPYQASAGAADPSSWNRYSYVGSDPVNYNDPVGLFALPVGIIVGGTIGGPLIIPGLLFSVFGWLLAGSGSGTYRNPAYQTDAQVAGITRTLEKDFWSNHEDDDLEGNHPMYLQVLEDCYLGAGTSPVERRRRYQVQNKGGAPLRAPGIIQIRENHGIRFSPAIFEQNGSRGVWGRGSDSLLSRTSTFDDHISAGNGGSFWSYQSFTGSTPNGISRPLAVREKNGSIFTLLGIHATAGRININGNDAMQDGKPILCDDTKK